jgi:hypothetical protein
MQTTDDLAQQVLTTLGDHAEDFDVAGIVEDLRAVYDGVRSVDDVPAAEYWQIVEDHDRTKRDGHG